MRRKIYQGLMALIIFLAIILVNTLFLFYDTSFVQNEFEKLDVKVSNATEIDQEIRDYLTGEKKELETDFLNQKEIQHLEDVKKLFTLGKILAGLLAFLITVGLFEFKKVEMPAIGYYIGAFVVVFTALALLVLNFFEISFVIFHKLLFTNDLWLMGAEDKIILLYPQQFFTDAFFTIAKRTLVMAFIAVVIFNIKYVMQGYRFVKSQISRMFNS